MLQNEEKVPYAFYVADAELAGELGAAMVAQQVSVEKAVSILFRPQAVFRVRPVGRCTASMVGAAIRRWQQGLQCLSLLSAHHECCVQTQNIRRSDARALFDGCICSIWCINGACKVPAALCV